MTAERNLFGNGVAYKNTQNHIFPTGQLISQLRQYFIILTGFSKPSAVSFLAESKLFCIC
jgi:hypothetical protein